MAERKVRFKDEGPVVHHYELDAGAGLDHDAEEGEIPPPPSPVAAFVAREDIPPAPPRESNAGEEERIYPPSISEPVPTVEEDKPALLSPTAVLAVLKKPVVASPNTTCNSLELAILTKQTTNLWAHRRSQHTPASLSTSLEVAYCPMPAVAKAFYHTQHELKTQDDILVCSPQRCGQTAVLDALFQLCNQHGSPTDQPADFVGWVGSASENEIPQNKTSSGKRLFKTHMNLQPFTRTMGKAPKVIVVLRDPFYVLDSWHRHVVDVFGMFNPDQTELVSGFSLEDFKDCMPGAYNAELGASNDLRGETYYKFISLALDLAAKDKNVKVVFYEQIVSDPESLVDEISQFVLGVPVFDPQVKSNILQSWCENRNSTNQLQVTPQLRVQLGEAWIKHFTAVFIQGMPIVPNSYYDLFANLTGAQTFPLAAFPFDKQRSPSRFTFSQIKRTASSGNVEIQQEVTRKLGEMKKLKSRAGSFVSKVAQVAIASVSSSPSTNSQDPPEAGGERRSVALVAKRKSVYAKVFG
ncbi:hypothetical protein BASA81_001210 [Batrachochytrium salamandrivorans]|nr:hypothetical protein BASA81_001210 [Batrachochytrium salamandrivorans]